MEHSSKKLSNLQLTLLFSVVIFSQLHPTLFAFYQPVFKPVHPYDHKVLVRIQKQMGKKDNRNWLTNDTSCCVDSCEYSGLVCSRFDGHIVEITLTFESPTTGSLLAVVTPLADLVSLKRLVLSGPYFTSPIPGRALRKLTNLTSLTIQSTSIKGPIPGSLFAMQNLTHLEINSNQFLTGRIPKALSKLTNLEYLDLDYNRLSGPIPNFFDSMSNLSSINLSDNRFSGPIPTSLGRLSKLQSLDLSYNQLTGSIPESLFSLSSSRDEVWVFLNHNRLTGSIPIALARSRMVAIIVSNNRLTDASNLFKKGVYSGLHFIGLSNNRLKFNFSKAYLPVNLNGLFINNNLIYGSLPKTMARLQWINRFDVSNNQLCGEIPANPLFEYSNRAQFDHNKCLCGFPLAPCK